jgi:hypothetical protein
MKKVTIICSVLGNLLMILGILIMAHDLKKVKEELTYTEQFTNQRFQNTWDKADELDKKLRQLKINSQNK